MIVQPRQQVKYKGKIYGAGSVLPDPDKRDSDFNKDIPVDNNITSSFDASRDEIKTEEPSHRDVIDDVLDGTMRKKPSRKRSYKKTNTGE